jgi:hypothetical protein
MEWMIVKKLPFRRRTLSVQRKTSPPSKLAQTQPSNLCLQRLEKIKLKWAIMKIKIGGNGAAKNYFRKHGVAIDTKGEGVEKKYKSKVAQSYRAELAK